MPGGRLVFARRSIGVVMLSLAVTSTSHMFDLLIFRHTVPMSLTNICARGKSMQPYGLRGYIQD